MLVRNPTSDLPIWGSLILDRGLFVEEDRLLGRQRLFRVEERVERLRAPHSHQGNLGV